MVYGRTIITEGKRSFQYPPGIPNLKIFEPIEVKPFKLRSNCVYNMLRLYTAKPLYPEQVNSYPDPNQWCDSIVDLWRNQYYINEYGTKKRSYTEKRIYNIFTCPNVREEVLAENPQEDIYDPNYPGEDKSVLKCHYAMNPNCRPDSPGDMVLLFETEAGWNQHGGEELFTFDNHDPKGGCVLLYYGTVKFIRTEEELKNLRWK